jgi:isopenicillin-N epimerase
VLVDGAHAPGAIALDIEALGVDWYAANLHKWALAPRACGVLWAAPQRRAGLHPTVLSWGLSDNDWIAEFDWTGTRDPSCWLSAPAGIAFMEDRLGVDAMRAHNHALAWSGARSLAARWGTHFGTPESMIGCMAAVPLPEQLGPPDPKNAQAIRDALFFDHRIELPVLAHSGALWARLSIQVYNDASDLERLADAIDAIATHGVSPASRDP